MKWIKITDKKPSEGQLFLGLIFASGGYFPAVCRIVDGHCECQFPYHSPSIMSRWPDWWCEIQDWHDCIPYMESPTMQKVKMLVDVAKDCFVKALSELQREVEEKNVRLFLQSNPEK